MIIACPACRRSLALADRNGRHVASEAHYPHLDAAGRMVCSPPARAAEARPEPARAVCVARRADGAQRL